MRADSVLGDEEPLRDLVRVEALLEEEEHLDLARRQPLRDPVGDAGRAPSLPDTLEESSCDAA